MFCLNLTVRFAPAKGSCVLWRESSPVAQVSDRDVCSHVMNSLLTVVSSVCISVCLDLTSLIEAWFGLRRTRCESAQVTFRTRIGYQAAPAAALIGQQPQDLRYPITLDAGTEYAGMGITSVMPSSQACAASNSPWCSALWIRPQGLRACMRSTAPTQSTPACHAALGSQSSKVAMDLSAAWQESVVNLAQGLPTSAQGAPPCRLVRPMPPFNPCIRADVEKGVVGTPCRSLQAPDHRPAAVCWLTCEP